MQTEEERRRRKNARMVIYNTKNREIIAVKKAARYESNREMVLKKAAIYRDQNRDKVRKSNNAQYWKNREYRLRFAAEYRAENPAKIKAYREANPGLFAAYRESRRAEMKAYMAAYHKAHPEKTRASNDLRRARKAKAPIGDRKIIEKWDKAWRSKSRVICYWCRQSKSPVECHADHIIPLDKGGPHSIENLCISCQPCNNRKNTKSVEAWNQHLAEPVLL